MYQKIKESYNKFERHFYANLDAYGKGTIIGFIALGATVIVAHHYNSKDIKVQKTSQNLEAKLVK